MFLPFAEWRPDVAMLNSAFAADILNVLCADGFYMPFPALSPLSGALPAPAVGAFMARSDDGQVTIFAGTATKLYKLDNSTLNWTDVSKTATTYAASSDERWQFAQFGDYVVAVNANDAPQVFQNGVSTRFDNLGGNPPRARSVATCGDFLFLGGLTDFPARVQWSALNNIASWTPGTNNADYQDFPDGGRVMGIIPSTNPIIIQRSAIRFATFVPGSTEVFTFQKVHDGRGAAAPYSICSRGQLAFYADSGGFFQLSADGSLMPIGFEKVDRTIFGKINFSDITATVGVIDPFYSRVYWSVKYSGGSAGFNRLIVYDWNLQKWSQVQLSGNVLFPISAATIGYTLDNLNSVSASLDALPFSLDSKVWQGGAPILGAFDSSNKLGFFSGDAVEAVLTTQELGDTAGTVRRVSETFPIIDTSNVLVAIGSRFRRGDVPVWTTEASPSSNTGIIRKIVRSRFHQFKMRVPATVAWTSAQGIDVKSVEAGLR